MAILITDINNEVSLECYSADGDITIDIIGEYHNKTQQNFISFEFSSIEDAEFLKVQLQNAINKSKKSLSKESLL